MFFFPTPVVPPMTPPFRSNVPPARVRVVELWPVVLLKVSKMPPVALPAVLTLTVPPLIVSAPVAVPVDPAVELV